MAVEISIEAFEKNAKNFNKNGLRRDFYSIYKHVGEYVNQAPLIACNTYVFECTIDKEYGAKFIEFLKNDGFTVLGSENYYFIERMVNLYNLNKERYRGVNPEAIEAINKDLDLMKERNKEYNEIQNDDITFNFLPFKEGIDSIFEFVKVMKDKILAFAKENDITIMLKIQGYNSQCDGFIGFNFFDADNKDEEVIIEYASRITIMVDFNDKNTVFSAGLLMSGIGETKEELLDSDINTHILAEGAKFVK